MYRKAGRWFRVATALLDAVLVNVAFLLAYWVRYRLQWFREVEEAHYVPFAVYLPSALALTGILLIVYLLGGLYRPRRGRPWLDEVYLLFQGTATGIATMIIVSLLSRPTLQSRLIFAYDAVIIVVLLSTARLLIGAAQQRLRKRGIGVDRVLVVGAGEIGRAVMRNIVAQPELGYQLVGFVDDAPEKSNTDLGRIKALGDTSQIPDLLDSLAIDEVIITLPWMSRHKVLSIVAQCDRQNVRAKIVPDLFQLSLSQVDTDTINGVPVIGIKEASIRGWNFALKRAMDLVGSVLIGLLLWPLMSLTALLIKLDSPGPVLFKQTRVGRDGRQFTVYKFRTMLADAENSLDSLLALNESSGPLFKMRNDPRMTRVGKFLRRSSVDELPQLYNVLRGEMSLVGPRPALPSEVAQYQAWHTKRLQASPGITGLWQVSGRSELAFEEMVLLDLYYIENWSLLLDLKIMLQTVPAVLFARGAF